MSSDSIQNITFNPEIVNFDDSQHGFDQNTLLYYRTRASEYTSLIEFFQDHGIFTAEKTLNSGILSPERFMQLYTSDVQNLGVFELFQLSRKVHLLSQSVSSISPKPINEIVGINELNHRMLIEKESHWLDLAEEMEDFTTWLKGLNGFDAKKIERLNVLHKDYLQALENQETKEQVKNEWFSLRIAYWNICTFIQSIFNSLLAFVGLSDPIDQESENNFQKQKDIRYEAAMKAANVFKEGAKKVDERLSQRRFEAEFAQSANDSWDAKPYSHYSFIQDQKEAIVQLKGLSQAARVAVSELEILKRRNLSSEWKSDLNKLLKVDTKLFSKVYYYLKQSKFPEAVVNPYMLTGSDTKEPSEVCSSKLGALILRAKEVLGEDSKVLQVLQRAKENLQSEYFKTALEVYHYKYLVHDMPQAQDFAKLTTGEPRAYRKGASQDREAIRKYRRMVLRLHPDKVSSKEFSSSEREFIGKAFIKIQHLHDLYLNGQN